jgi:hypothetical protein
MVESSSRTTDVLIQYRRDIADLQRRVRNRRIQTFGLYGTPVLAAVILLIWATLKVVLWLNSETPHVINGILGGIFAFLVVAFIVQAVAEFSDEFDVWNDRRTSIRNLRLELSLAEERNILEARRRTPPPEDRQSSYKERLPGEVSRLRRESRRYRRMHLFTQWALFFSSAAFSAATAWYDPPQPGKAVLIGLGFVVTLITAATGYFKPRERAFNLQQTADNIEQHANALELGIAPYNMSDDARNLEMFATTVEGLRAEQRMREQQLDQPQQGQQQVI